jgi:hypothetical protein
MKIREVIIWAAFLAGSVGMLFLGLAAFLAIAGGTP